MQVRLFGPAREAAGVAGCEFEGERVCEILHAATNLFGEGFAAVLASSKVWVNGEPADMDDLLEPSDELAILPPVSGG